MLNINENYKSVERQYQKRMLTLSEARELALKILYDAERERMSNAEQEAERTMDITDLL